MSGKPFSAKGHNKHRTPPKPKRPEAVRKEMRARDYLDDQEAAEELKNVPAKRKKL